MTKIKICGIRRIEDIHYVNEFLPDYIGFIFANSRRYVSPELAEELIKELNPQIKTVGVFVNEDIDNVVRITNMLNLDVVQLHGDEDNNYILKLRNKNLKEIWKAIRVESSDDLVKMESILADRFLLDTYKKGEYGGVGEKFNWELLDDIDCKEIILAGGIDAGNIKEAIRRVKPFMIDVSSGVESEGVKDRDKIREIMEKKRVTRIYSAQLPLALMK